MSYLIGIAGPSASGKSTLCEELVKLIPDSLLISQDDYWKNPELFPKVKGLKNWELPENIDFDRLYQNLLDLKEGKATVAPKWVRGHYPPGTQTFSSKKYIFVEGFRLFHDSRIKDIIDYKIYVDITAEEIIKRRLQRLRHGQLEREWYYREIVVEEDSKYGVPMKKYADLIVDGTRPIINSVQKIEEIILQLTSSVSS